MRRNKKVQPKEKSKFAIVVEGECEFWYIQMLKRNEKLTNVTLKPEIPQRKRLSEQYAKVVELSNDYDKVYWIIDFDVINKETRETKKGIKTALQEFREYYYNIKNNHDNIIAIVNNPCFEFWILLHFEDSSRLYRSYDELVKQLKKHLPDYEKTQKYYTKQNKDIYLKLLEKLPAATSNAKKLNKFNFEEMSCSVSEMFILIETIEQFNKVV